MMRGLSTLTLLATLALVGAGAETAPEGEFALFPASGEAWVGDPMPFFDDGVFWVYFLEDLRSSAQGGYHPVGLLTSSDLSHYRYRGIVIPFGSSPRAQDRAIGTGSVVKDATGLYHMFYTGHNDYFEPREAILHAVSSDRVRWTKLSGEVLLAPARYTSDDFRDPYVFYNQDEGLYWMLITTRVGDQGVIALQTSADLVHWVDEGVFFRNDLGTNSNLECPSLVFHRGLWYLAFSDQWPDRVVHYRIGQSARGPFIKPTQDRWDGSGFYAGRLAADESDLYVFGWVPTRAEYRDQGPYQWGGNLVAHRLVPQVDGALVSGPIPSVGRSLAKRESSAAPTFTMDGTSKSMNLGELSGTFRLEGRVRTEHQSGRFGFTLGVKDGTGTVQIVLEPGASRICTYNVPLDDIATAQAESWAPWQAKAGESKRFTLLIDGSVGAFYLEGYIALTFRSFSMQDRAWDIFCLGATGELSDLEIFR